MKFLIETLAIAFLIVVHMGRGDDDPHEATRAKCRAEFDLTEEETMKGVKSPRPDLGCYLNCLFLDAGIMTPDGVMYAKKFVEEIGEDLREESESAIYACIEDVKDIDDTCESSFTFVECFRQKLPETFVKLGIFGRPPTSRKN